MKKLSLFFFLACMAFSVSAQSSEGSVKYSITYEGKDVEQYKPMMPTAYRMTFKNGNAKMVTEGGVQASMIGDIIVMGAEKTTYFVNHTTKTANKMKQEESKSENDEKPVVTKESGSATILGYKCQKYKVTFKSKSGGEDMVNYIWAAKDINIKRPEGQFGASQYMYEGVEGFPLKMEMNMNQGGMSIKMVMTAVDVNLNPVDAKEFEIPASYKVEEGLPALLKMQMGEK